jgi:hypothetical protein
MCHVGSQGMPLDFMVEGATKIVKLADQIDIACGEKRISCIDIGNINTIINNIYSIIYFY